jgi:hypothetical protein
MKIGDSLKEAALCMDPAVKYPDSLQIAQLYFAW